MPITMYTTVGPYSYKLFSAVICYKTEYIDITVLSSFYSVFIPFYIQLNPPSRYHTPRLAWHLKLTVHSFYIIRSGIFRNSVMGNTKWVDLRAPVPGFMGRTRWGLRDVHRRLCLYRHRCPPTANSIGACDASVPVVLYILVWPCQTVDCKVKESFVSKCQLLESRQLQQKPVLTYSNKLFLKSTFAFTQYLLPCTKVHRDGGNATHWYNVNSPVGVAVRHDCAYLLIGDPRWNE